MSILLQKRTTPQKNTLFNLKSLVSDKRFERFIMACILCNAVTLGLETSDTIMNQAGLQKALSILDKVFIGIFTLEVLLKASLKKTHYFKDPWNIFDLIIVGISWLPALGSFSALRALRVLRVLRLISVVPSLKRVVEGLLSAIPGLGVVFAILMLVFYIGAVIATNLFKSAFPEWFGNLGSSAYSLFQIMTLESWSMGIVRPVMEVYPYAWIFFIPFIFITTFTMLNLLIGVIVNALQLEHQPVAVPTDENAAPEATLARIEQQQAKILDALEKKGMVK